MAFNFAGMIGGFSRQVVQDIEDQEKEVKLRTRTILDKQVEEVAENRKKYNEDKEKVEKQINSIAQLFDPTDPFRFNKARSIVAGGDEHYNTMYKELSTHKRLGGDMNQAYSYTASNEEQGFEGVADAAKGLAKLRTISVPEFGKKGETESVFGIDLGTELYRSTYESARKQYEQAGLLPSSTAEFEDSVKKYGTGTINFQNLKKDKKDIDTMYANNMQAILDLDKKDPKYAEKRAKLESEQEELTKGVAKMNSVSASVIAEKERQAGKSTTGQTLTEMKNLYKDSRNKYQRGLQYSKTDGIINDNGETLFDNEAKEYFDNKMKEWDKNYVRGLVDGNGDLIDNSSDSQSFLKAFDLDQYVGTPEEKDDTTKPKKITFEDKVKSAQDAGSPEAFLQGELGKISKGLSEDRKNKIYQKIFEIVQNAYPDSANIQEIVNKEIDKYEKAQKSKTFVRSKKDVSDPNNTEKPVIQDDKGEDITNPNFKYSGAI